MTNRQKFFQKMAEYDLLMLMHERLYDMCILSLIGDMPECRKYDSCEQCIQHWLNEEVQR